MPKNLEYNSSSFLCLQKSVDIFHMSESSKEDTIYFYRFYMRYSGNNIAMLSTNYPQVIHRLSTDYPGVIHKLSTS
ncbi:hypothetical protein HUT03_00385 [Candidatus Liberibacter africanus]|uniref:Uncharacterized protein n=1 Tax=Candidatus Liberibacter africanus PTSAPSY TaxID=1277257 RepID=A0A0G3I1K1_LIBAF|nr:hypothetical protein G293_00420 [Candidatus Liberibacter africanus PTSAPSY]QTP63615.1 hypothetical protein HUT03_00385 [Candidatus Liberibacter africanus]